MAPITRSDRRDIQFRTLSIKSYINALGGMNAPYRAYRWCPGCDCVEQVAVERADLHDALLYVPGENPLCLEHAKLMHAHAN